LAALALAAAGIDAARWLDLPRALVQGRSAAFAGWPMAQVVDALQKTCHDAMVVAAGGRPRYFALSALPGGADASRLLAWSGSLARVARHVDHAWNEGLLIDALVGEGRACWQETTTRPSSGRRPLDTLDR
jgi:DNA polymerase-3 subunit delta'